MVVKRIAKNRDIRKKAFKATNDFFAKHAEEFDLIFDKLVKIRDKKASILGF